MTGYAEPLDHLEQSFRRHLRAEGKAARTVTLYCQAVRFYGEWLTVQGKPAASDEVTKANIIDWLGCLSAEKAVGTVRTRWRGLHRFCRWAVDEGVLDTHPMAGLAQPAPEDKPVPIVADEMIHALLTACKGKTFADVRDTVILRLLADCGLRVSELTGITLDGVDLNAETVLVHGKGSKIRLAYPSSKTIRALDRYLRERRRHRHASDGALLLGERGPMTSDGVRERLLVRARHAGIEDRLHPHMLRHAWAHDFLLAGGEGRDLMRLAGWTSEAMLGVYGRAGADHRAREAAKRMRRGDRL